MSLRSRPKSSRKPATEGEAGQFFPDSAPWWIGLVWASGGEFFKTQGDSWVQTLNNPAAEKVLSYWDDLVKKNSWVTCLLLPPSYSMRSPMERLPPGWNPHGARACSPPRLTIGHPATGASPRCPNGIRIRKQSKHPKAAALFCIWLNTAKAPIVTNWNNFGLFPAAVAGLSSPDLNQPDKNPGKFCGGQDVAKVYAQASEAVNPDFAWAPWFAFVNDNYNKHIEALFSGQIHLSKLSPPGRATALRTPGPTATR
jgi:multiple sugar transport system substrate-binding protein